MMADEQRKIRKRGGNPNPTPLPAEYQFKPGQSGNPGGRGNARNRLSKRFLEDLADDFDANGKSAIEAARTADPMGYVRAIASLMPKEFIVERPLESLSDDELTAAIADLRARLGETPKPPALTGGQSAATGDATKH